MDKKILFVVDEMNFGGVSVVLRDVLENIQKENYQIDLLVLHKHGEMLCVVPKDISIIEGSSFFSVIDEKFSALKQKKQYVKCLKKIWLAFLMKTKLIKYIIPYERKKILKDEYDIEIAFKDGFCTIFTCFGSSKKKIAWVHNDYKIFNGAARYNELMSKSFEGMDTIVAVSQHASDMLKEVFNISKNLTVISNPLNEKNIMRLSTEFSPNYEDKSLNFVSIGRICHQKAYDRLIKIHKQLLDEGYLHRIYIVGDGEDSKDLKEMISNLQVEKSFVLVGYQKNPYPYIAAADGYILSSRHEGYGLVVTEAFILHVPVISTDVADVRERMNNEKYGMTVENSYDGLLVAMREVITHSQKLQQYKNNLSTYHFNSESIYSQINNLLE
ncbi:glycosyltransferase [Scatolibacter rhodanostii]|uniref:glycosyltransferase n=1 Tax=Scatolibacter rhodanostii TaxID=2014781 RepID=UPI000C07F7BE|nr:glycosyltransferase [Scatolibacter rhodanostii]